MHRWPEISRQACEVTSVLKSDHGIVIKHFPTGSWNSRLFMSRAGTCTTPKQFPSSACTSETSFHVYLMYECTIWVIPKSSPSHSLNIFKCNLDTLPCSGVETAALQAALREVLLPLIPCLGGHAEPSIRATALIRNDWSIAWAEVELITDVSDKKLPASHRC